MHKLRTFYALNSKEECEAIVREAWEFSAHQNPIDGVLTSSDICRTKLIHWASLETTNPHKKIKRLQKQLAKIRRRVQTVEAKEENSKMAKELEGLYEDQTAYWQQRGKMAWMKDGGRNTQFFHAKATFRRNKVTRLEDILGNKWEDKRKMQNIVEDYFWGLFSPPNPGEASIDAVLQSIYPRVSHDASLDLIRPFTSSEVHHAISAMSPLKSPGLDGYTVIFYNKYWPIIGSYVTNYVLDFVNNHKLPAPMNFTYIVLIPKTKNPSKMSDFRPIILCNVIYKIGAKMVANRLKPHLCDIISPTQSAFVPKCLIPDNVLAAFETHHYINSYASRTKKIRSLKLDIKKAYDRVEWIFLHKVLIRLGIPLRMVELIMLFVSSVSFSFLWRGIRQGDPLSYYLFICIMEAFIGLVSKVEQEGRLHGVKIARTAPSVTNLCFADDTMIFCQANEAEAMTLKQILDTYAMVSGQAINFEKSSVAFSRTLEVPQQDII